MLCLAKQSAESLKSLPFRKCVFIFCLCFSVILKVMFQCHGYVRVRVDMQFLVDTLFCATFRGEHAVFLLWSSH